MFRVGNEENANKHWKNKKIKYADFVKRKTTHTG